MDFLFFDLVGFGFDLGAGGTGGYSSNDGGLDGVLVMERLDMVEWVSSASASLKPKVLVIEGVELACAILEECAALFLWISLLRCPL